jgi:CBS domain-containing protein
MKARELMSTNLVVVPPETPASAVAALLASRGISAVPVVDASGAPVGLVTEGDLIRRLADEKPGPVAWFVSLFKDTGKLADRFSKAHGKTARDVMTAELATVGEDATAEDIAKLMEARGIRRVPVVKDGRLAGIVSRADLLRAVLAPKPQPEALANDAAILRAVLSAMRDQPWADSFWVFPDVAEGAVTLCGFYRSDAVRHGLKVLVGEIPGVKRVEDKMEPMPTLARMQI